MFSKWKPKISWDILALLCSFSITHPFIEDDELDDDNVDGVTYTGVFINTVNLKIKEQENINVIKNHIDGLVQDCSNSIAFAMELLQSCNKPLIYWYCLYLAITLCSAVMLYSDTDPGQHWLR